MLECIAGLGGDSRSRKEGLTQFNLRSFAEHETVTEGKAEERARKVEKKLNQAIAELVNLLEAPSSSSSSPSAAAIVSRSDSTGIFVSSSGESLPHTIYQILHGLQAFPRYAVLLQITTLPVPYVDLEDRQVFTVLSEKGLFLWQMFVGYHEPNIPFDNIVAQFKTLIQNQAMKREREEAQPPREKQTPLTAITPAADEDKTVVNFVHVGRRNSEVGSRKSKVTAKRSTKLRFSMPEYMVPDQFRVDGVEENKTSQTTSSTTSNGLPSSLSNASAAVANQGFQYWHCCDK